MERLRERRILELLFRCSLLVGLVRMEEVFNTMPPPVRTNFSCFGRAMGFYADIEANCRVYHTCDDHANKFSYHCPEETAFRQDALICDHAHLVDCQATVQDSPKLPANFQAEQDKADTRHASFNIPASSSLHDRRSFSRSFQVIQRPDKYSSNKYSQPGFIFSASVFLRDRDSHSQNDQPIVKTVTDRRVCDVNRERSDSKNTVATLFSTVRPFINGLPPKTDAAADRSPGFLLDKDRFAMIQRLAQSRDRTLPLLSGLGSTQRPETGRSTESSVFRSRDSSTRADQFRPFGEGRRSQKTASIAPPDSPIRKAVSGASVEIQRTRNRDYPYLETLRSIQANSRTETTFTTTFTTTSSPRTSAMSMITAAKTPATTELPVHALTVSLKPLVPNELEYDPYYPRTPTSTEAYYTPNHRGKGHQRVSTHSTPASWSDVKFEIPAVLPDLNTLDDLVDRRRLFYIPRVRTV